MSDPVLRNCSVWILNKIKCFDLKSRSLSFSVWSWIIDLVNSKSTYNLARWSPVYLENGWAVSASRHPDLATRVVSPSTGTTQIHRHRAVPRLGHRRPFLPAVSLGEIPPAGPPAPPAHQASSEARGVVGSGEGGVAQLGGQELPSLHPAGGRPVQLQRQRGQRFGTPFSGINILGLILQSQQVHNVRWLRVRLGLIAGVATQENPARPIDTI